MRIISFRTLREYYEENSSAKTALENWYKVTSSAEWNSLNDIKNDFNSVDYVGNQRYVFNIKGNHYRLIVLILFSIQRVYVRFVGTHAEYDKITDIQNI
uniref:type II toxin-antitoxin system HigB family toxin n=1 Tax=Ornithobacterium rhinotracheale TaxID=28251 RepID=UPI0039A53BF1